MLFQIEFRKINESMMFNLSGVRVSIRTCVPNLATVRRERYLTIYNPLNPPGVGWVKF